jgi:sugar phosphate isomerase/epimerase
MKIGCGATYTNALYATFEHGSYRRVPSIEDLIKSIEWAASAGFEAIELEMLSNKHADNAFGEKNVAKLASLAEQFHVKISDLSVPFISREFPLGDKLEPIKERFRQTIQVGKALSTETVATISPPYPDTILAPYTLYPDGPPLQIVFHRNGEWRQTWQAYVSWVGELCDIARSDHLKLMIEPRPREIISNTEAMLMLLKEIRSSNLGVLFDTSHHFVMKEILPISIWKLGEAIFGVHLADNDGIIEHYWAPGEGKIDWMLVLQALKDEGYNGFLTIEASGFNRSKEDFLQAKLRVEKWLGSLDEEIKLSP